MANGCGIHWLPNRTPVLTAKRRDRTNSAILVWWEGSNERKDSFGNVWWFNTKNGTVTFQFRRRWMSYNALWSPILFFSIGYTLVIFESKFERIRLFYLSINYKIRFPLKKKVICNADNRSERHLMWYQKILNPRAFTQKKEWVPR